MALQKQKEEEKCIHKILESFKSPSQLLQVLEVAANLHPFILHTILSILEYNPSLCPKNTSESLHKFFSRCEENEEEGANMVILDKATRKVAFKNWVDDGGGPRGTRIEDKTPSVVGPVGDDCGASSS
ncbi:hypothetical protein ACH5RR_037569 [Cinchona calisaya]|uniref:Uncharacterized protein n=1 Tax=Cinchona calisaya TaxID=153742 RepID=A0ABD2Y7X3_9GENT